MKLGIRFINVSICMVFFATLFFVPATPAIAKDIKIAQLHPMTGALAVIGQAAKRGHEIAIEEINAKGGIKSLGGAKLVLLNGDSQGKPEVGMAEAERLILDGAVAVMGSYQSSVTFAVSQVAEKKRIPYIIPMAMADDIMERGFKYTYRVMSYGSSMVAESALGYIMTLGKLSGKPAKRIGLIYEDTMYGKSAARYYQDAIKGTGLEIVADISYSAGAADLTSEVTKLKAAKPDILIPINYVTDGILLVRTLSEMKVNLIAIMGGANVCFTDKAFIDSLGKIAEYTMNTAPGYNERNPEALAVAKKYEEKYKTTFNTNVAYSYVATYVLADALERAKSTNPEDIVKALSTTDMKKHDIMTEKGVKFGTVKKMKNQNIHNSLVVHQVLGGKLHCVYPAEYATKKPVWPVPAWDKR